MRKSRFAKTICTLIMPIINQESGPTVGATAPKTTATGFRLKNAI